VIRFPLRRDQHQSLLASFHLPETDEPFSPAPAPEAGAAAVRSDAAVESAATGETFAPNAASGHPDEPGGVDSEAGGFASPTFALAPGEPAETPPSAAQANSIVAPAEDTAEMLASFGWIADDWNDALAPDPGPASGGNPMAAADPAPRIGQFYYVDATAGSDSNDGLSPGAAFKTLAKVESLLAEGDTILLKRGAVWHEPLRISAAEVTVEAYGSGANPLIDGDAGSRNGIVITGRDAHVADIDVTSAHNGLYITGASASATIIGGTFTANGTGIAAGGGGRLILADGVHCTGSLTARGAGDGIQISADASSGAHTIVNAVCNGNDIAGINAKSGTVVVSASTLSYNGEPGWIAQNNIALFDISGSRIEGNNQHDNGTGQASIEDTATVHSRDNLYIDPHNGALATVQINMIATGGAFHSLRDTFVNQHGQHNTIGSIRVHTEGNPAIVSILEAIFEHAAGSGTAVHAYGATGLTLTLKSNLFAMADTIAVRVNSAAALGAELSTNSFTRADSGTVFAIENSVSYTLAEIADLFGQYAGSVYGSPVSGPMSAGAQDHSAAAGAFAGEVYLAEIPHPHLNAGDFFIA
jgi:hypothetical protein